MKTVGTFASRFEKISYLEKKIDAADKLASVMAEGVIFDMESDFYLRRLEDEITYIRVEIEALRGGEDGSK